MRYLDVCSGISAPTAAWQPLGWKCAGYAEIEPFPRAVLEHHYPQTPLHGDFTAIEERDVGPLDLLVGGTPCQDFSVAGLRAGLDGHRGNLSLEYMRLADRTRPRWLVWENVPGVLSLDAGKAFGAILGAMGELGYGFAYRVLDAQYFGVPQRRRRVFVIGHLGDWRPAAAVLFERHSLQGHPAPRRETGQRIANAITERPDRGGGNSEGQRLITQGCGGLIAHSLRGEGFDASEDGTGRGTPLVPVAFSADWAVRRLTPRECERLQGFPNDFTAVPYRGKPAADGPRYKALGNSMAVPVVRWLGERIDAVDAMPAGRVWLASPSR